jgi:8-oxo-dGTP pyrophosphatase MutT (NUDIX family)
VEPGERQEAAVIREVKEEVGVTVRPVRKVWESISQRASLTSRRSGLRSWSSEKIFQRA